MMLPCYIYQTHASFKPSGSENSLRIVLFKVVLFEMYLYSMQIIRWLVYSNCWIALGAVAILQTGYLLLGQDMHWDALAILVFFATWGVYLLIRLVAKDRIGQYEKDDRWKFFFKNYGFMVGSVVLFFVIVAVLFFQLPVRVRWLLIGPGCISMLYGLPLLSKNTRLRDVGIIKIFLIAIVWAFTGSFLPAAQVGVSVFSFQSILLFAAQFLFILGITIPFDIKDLEIDAISDVKTIPSILGTEWSYSLSFSLIFASAACHQWMLSSYNSSNLGVPVGVGLLITGMLIYATQNSKNNLVYFFGIDGTIILQWLLIYTYLRFS